MSKSEGFDYYRAYAAQAAYAQEMALNLVSAMEAGELGTRELMSALHTVENDADQINHDIQDHLMGDFVVPLERSSMGSLAHTLDDICDAVEEIAIKAFLYHVDSIGDEGAELACSLAAAIGELKDAVDMLAEFSKHAKGISNHLVKVQTFESDCDDLYIEAVHDLYGDGEIDAERRRIAHAMLDAVENAMDTVENAAERVEAVIAENM